jgi:hypothetical protein
LSLEKNQRISIGRYQKWNGSEDMQVSFPSGLSLNSVLERTRSAMGGKFLPYSVSNNCQDFLLNLLLSNNIATPSNTTFVKQATQSVIPPNVRKVSNTTTDLAGKADIIFQSGDIGKPQKKPNAWIQHVRQFSKALSDPRCKSQYRKVIGVGVSSSSWVSPSDDLDPNISKEETRRIHTEMGIKQKREAYDRELTEFLAFERLSDSQKDKVDARDLLKLF